MWKQALSEAFYAGSTFEDACIDACVPCDCLDKARIYWAAWQEMAAQAQEMGLL